MSDDGRRRVVIDGLTPEVAEGQFPIKRVPGEAVVVEADIFSDGHDEISALLLHRRAEEAVWRETPMHPLVNDRWQGTFTVEREGEYRYTVLAWIDFFRTWLRDLSKRHASGAVTQADLLVGAMFIEETASRVAGGERERLWRFATALRETSDPEHAARAVENDELRALMAARAVENDELRALVAAHADRSLATAYRRELTVVVDRAKALFSAWYESFPRSWSETPGRHGAFRDGGRLLPQIAAMGFDVLYLPPIHPIGRTNRKGPNNSTTCGPDDPGSPWAIGSDEGGHKAIHPQLGTFDDFDRFLQAAAGHGLEVALDLAFQCSPDHPYIREHPEWFAWRPDGTIQHAENPPKKYEDIVPFRFETAAWRELWEELKSIVLFWVDRGVRIFRVDNPHTKPFAFWHWLMTEVKRAHPDVLFLSEAFTRPKMMDRLAMIDFTQSYTYFTWRNSKAELMQYLTELTRSRLREFLRPSFWPNTPDILPEYLQYGGRPAFITRLVLAATLSSNYGIYGPPFELCVTEALPGKEEYLHSEKFELRHWDEERPGNLKALLTRVNGIRRENPALHTTCNLTFCEVDSEHLLAALKMTPDRSNILLIVVNLDPFHRHGGRLRLPLEALGMAPDQPYLLLDLLGDQRHFWQGETHDIDVDPAVTPAHIFRLHKRLRRENDFDYFI